LKFALKRPVVLTEGSAPITELTLREDVCAGDMRGIAMRDPMHFDDMLKIAARLSGQPDAVISKIHFADTMALIEVIAGFLSAGL
jgi:hypothetical protein